MKIEKVNDNQIRCTLTKEDLASRSLKISELAYGTQKAKDLFRDMMQQASLEFGFEAEDIPLMIEAIPFSECVVLIITRVEDPEELDTRFSKFAPSNEDDEEEDMEYPSVETYPSMEDSTDHTADLLNLFNKLKNGFMSQSQEQSTTASAPVETPKKEIKAAPKNDKIKGLMQAFVFDSMTEVIDVAHIVHDRYQAPSSLYRNDNADQYLLLVKQGDSTIEEFAKVCNLLSEYASLFRPMSDMESYCEEHFTPVSIGSALQVLSQI